MDDRSQRIHDYSDRLARNIMLEVMDGLKQRSISASSSASQLTASDSPRSSPRLSRSSAGSGEGKVRKRKTAREEAEIDLLADRLTSDIITHATYNDNKATAQTCKMHKFEKHSDITVGQAANEYQKMVIEYQNQNGFEGEFDASTRRSSIWGKQPRATSIWNRTDD